MARWDDESFHTSTPNDMMCTTCKYKLKPITISGYTQDRAGYAVCDKYEHKPTNVLLNGELCPMFEKEE